MPPLSPLTAVYALVFYVATAVFAVGLAARIISYARTPAPLKIPIAPAPVTRSGVVLRMAREVLLFESLFKANKWIWIFGVLFHAALALIVLRHLRYFADPLWTWVALIQPFGVYAGFVLVIGLGGLWVRRLVVDRVRYISAPSDHLMLALLAGIGVTGLTLRYVARTDIIAVKAFFLGLMLCCAPPAPAVEETIASRFPLNNKFRSPASFFSASRLFSLSLQLSVPSCRVANTCL